MYFFVSFPYIMQVFASLYLMGLFVSVRHLMQALLKFVSNFAQSIGRVHPSPEIIMMTDECSHMKVINVINSVLLQ